MRIPFDHARRGLLVAALGTAASFVHAQPNVIKMIVPFPAGGITDQVARIVAEQMSQRLGQPVIVDNRPGAGGRLGIDAVTKSPPDGNTLLFTNTSYSIYPVVNPKAGFDPVKALVPVSLSACLPATGCRSSPATRFRWPRCPNSSRTRRKTPAS